jgi:anti-sigma regulatory factor (Ser/Thr protein kinase)
MNPPATRAIELPSTPRSVGAARRFVAAALPPLAPETCEHILLLTSEIVTNAIVHARTPFRLVVEARRAAVRVEVRDADPGRPVIHRPDPDEEHGRGLLIVQSIADSWGVDTGIGGKTVWFTVGVG